MEHPLCPHCNSKLQAFELPDEGGWEGDFQLACFNDECPYYVRGWQHIEEKYNAHASYRYRVDPTTGTASPLAVWSPTAIKDRIIEATFGGDDSHEPDNGSGEQI